MMKMIKEIAQLSEGLNPNQFFTPQGATWRRLEIARVLSDALGQPIAGEDPRLTNELCQEFMELYMAALEKQSNYKSVVDDVAKRMASKLKGG